MREILWVTSIVLTVLFVAVGMYWYAKETKEKSTPNFVVISLWALIAVANTITYAFIVADWSKWTLNIVGLLANIFVLGVILLHKNYILYKEDIMIIVTGILIVLVLIVFMNMKDLHIIMQIINTVVYIPLILRIYDGTGKEPFWPWIVISLGTVTNLVTVLLHYTDYWSLIHPLRSLVCQIIVIVIIRVKEIRTARF